MTALAWITAIVLGAGFGMSGIAKLMKHKMMVESAEHFGFSPSQYQLLGAAEVAGGAGVLLGLLIDSLSGLGVLAAAGLILVAVGGLFFHVRAKDPVAQMMPLVMLGGAAVLYIVAAS